jgi:alpha-glucosidase
LRITTGSGPYVPEQAPALGDTVSVFVRVPASASVRRVYVRTTPDHPGRRAALVLTRAGWFQWASGNSFHSNEGDPDN